ncbi:hypothetical protein OSH93_12515, partial [Mycobacterium ulcerans]|nr:hypothetical protein [Mycobacterium ulcerans]MEB3978217.1 hypothetical protein [Mycobacterium ulcerans]MEB4435244.1 hypothetical protein [Mycobacterium ulcerans]
PPPRPPQSTIPQLTSLLINNAGALDSIQRSSHLPATATGQQMEAATMNAKLKGQRMGVRVA